MKRVGVFVCHCGLNIAGTVRVSEVVDQASKTPDVVIAADHRYLCSEPGQTLIKDSIKQHRLDAIVVAACSPAMHEVTFRNTARAAGLNRHQCEMANIREQCSWVHDDIEKATEKAHVILRQIIEKVKLNEPLDPIIVPVTRRALVIGGGVAGIRSALDIAGSGYQVYLVEKTGSIGGRMAQLSETYPTLDCSICILGPLMVEAFRNPNIKILRLSEVEDVKGYVGNFKVRVRQEPVYVDETKCNMCAECAKVCPAEVPNEFDSELTWRKAVYIPFAQAVPPVYVLDAKSCLGLLPQACGECKKACDKLGMSCINLDAHPEIHELEVGAIISATGYELFDATRLTEYGYSIFPDVMTSLEFERMLSASGPTSGTIRRPSDGRIPKEVVFIQCAGQREPETALAYCSKICCMYTARHAMLFHHKVPDGQAYVFYMDIRAGGKGYEEFVKRCQEEGGLLYLRGRVAKVYEEKGKLVVKGIDTLSGKTVEIHADLVVLALGMVPSRGSRELANILKASVDENGFFAEAHPKLRPLESATAGIFVAGAGQAPKDIPETVAQASGAACKALNLLSSPTLEREPTVARIVNELCSGCGICIPACPFEALSLNRERRVAEVAEAVCEGCGTCIASCPSGALSLRNLTDTQIIAMITAGRH
ncbi:MAG: CoB--CoM heterodisulfide reductase iron-sulfur subunit A family protein [Candidatus Bathyarchaeia archaeon]